MIADIANKDCKTRKKFFFFKGLEVKQFFTACRLLLKSPLATVLYLPEPQVDHSKALLITGRAVGKACVRNRLRRLAKAIFFEQQFITLKITLAIIFRPKNMANRATLEELFKKIAIKVLRLKS
jgi:ribonuclease P protein component